MLIQHSMEQRKKDFTFSFHYNDTKMQKKINNVQLFENFD